MTRLPFLSVPRGVKISTLPLPDSMLTECTFEQLADVYAMIAQAKREPRRSETVRGLRLIRGQRCRK
jgi:hypothetical protein